MRTRSSSASTFADATAANPVPVNTLVAQGPGTHVLTAVDQRDTARFAGVGGEYRQHESRITLANHGLVDRPGRGRIRLVAVMHGKITELTDNRVYFVISIDH